MVPPRLLYRNNPLERRKQVKKFKVKLGWVQSGAKASTEELLKWIESSSDKEVSKKKLVTCAGVAGGAVLLVVQVPMVGPTAIVVAALTVFAWFDRTPREEMRMKFSDFGTETFVIGDEQVPGMEVLRRYIEANPGRTAAEHAEYLSQAPGSPRISPRLMAGVMTELGIPHPRTEVTGEQEEKISGSTPPEGEKEVTAPSESGSAQVGSREG
jgi:hypothetical protein